MSINSHKACRRITWGAIRLRTVTEIGGLEAFAAALRERLAAVPRKEFAEAMNISDAMVSHWTLAKNTPTPEQVFAMEDALNLPAGDLSRHLGYVRVGVVSVLASIEGDPSLSPRDRKALATLYRSFSSDTDS